MIEELNCRTGKNTNETYSDLVFKNVMQCVQCGSNDINFWYRKTTRFDINQRWQCMYECNGSKHRHSIMDDQITGYGRTLKAAISTAKKEWNSANKTGKKKNNLKATVRNANKLQKIPAELENGNPPGDPETSSK